MYPLKNFIAVLFFFKIAEIISPQFLFGGMELIFETTVHAIELENGGKFPICCPAILNKLEEFNIEMENIDLYSAKIQALKYSSLEIPFLRPLSEYRSSLPSFIEILSKHTYLLADTDNSNPNLPEVLKDLEVIVNELKTIRSFLSQHIQKRKKYAKYSRTALSKKHRNEQKKDIFSVEKKDTDF